MDHTVFTLQTHHTCLPLHRKRSPDGATISDSSHLITAYYSFVDPERMKGWVALVSYLQRTVYPYKWLPISCMSGAGQGKFAGQRPMTVYHWATPLNTLLKVEGTHRVRTHTYYYYAADKQTNRQTDRQTNGLERSTHADRPGADTVGVGNKWFWTDLTCTQSMTQTVLTSARTNHVC